MLDMILFLLLLSSHFQPKSCQKWKLLDTGRQKDDGEKVGLCPFGLWMRKKMVRAKVMLLVASHVAAILPLQTSFKDTRCSYC